MDLAEVAANGCPFPSPTVMLVGGTVDTTTGDATRKDENPRLLSHSRVRTSVF